VLLWIPLGYLAIGSLIAAWLYIATGGNLGRTARELLGFLLLALLWPLLLLSLCWPDNSD